MRCNKCAGQNSPGARFCTRCGSALMVACTTCGRGSPETARFCGWCGAARTAPALVLEPRGERKHATVLFADIDNSTELIADLDIEAAVGRLQPVVAAMVQGVQRFGGTVLRTAWRRAEGGVRGAQGARGSCVAGLPGGTRHAGGRRCPAEPALDPDRPALRRGDHRAARRGLAVEQEAQGMTVHVASRMEQVGGARWHLPQSAMPRPGFRLLRYKIGWHADVERSAGNRQGCSGLLASSRS